MLELVLETRLLETYLRHFHYIAEVDYVIKIQRRVADEGRRRRVGGRRKCVFCARMNSLVARSWAILSSKKNNIASQSV